MQTTASYNAALFQSAEQNGILKKAILQHCPAKKIYLLGITHQRKRTESLFALHGVATNWTSHYYLLILLEKTKEISLSAAQDKIENNGQHNIPLTVLALYLEEFIQWLLEGHPFAAAVYEKAFLLYSEEDYPLPIPAPVNEEAIKKEREALYRDTKSKLRSFLAGGQLYTVRKEYGFAALMLHQAAEQALRTMLTVNTGLTINTHNLDKLIHYCSMFSYTLPDVFPKNNEKEKRLFTLLNKAYIDTRYTNSYAIAYEELLILTERVKTIHEVFERYKPNGS